MKIWKTSIFRSTWTSHLSVKTGLWTSNSVFALTKALNTFKKSWTFSKSSRKSLSRTPSLLKTPCSGSDIFPLAPTSWSATRKSNSPIMPSTRSVCSGSSAKTPTATESTIKKSWESSQTSTQTCSFRRICRLKRRFQCSTNKKKKTAQRPSLQFSQLIPF